jgi:hypothetical protein
MRWIATLSLVLALSACGTARPAAEVTLPDPPLRPPRPETRCTPGAPRFVPFGRGVVAGRAAIDEEARKLVMVSEDEGRILLFRCELDGSGCVRRDASLELGEPMGDRESVILFDRRRGKLLVVMLSEPNWSQALELLSCDRDGTRCSHGPLPHGNLVTAPTSSGSFAAVLDPIEDRLIVVSYHRFAGYPRLIRCRPDRTECSTRDLPLRVDDIVGALVDPTTHELVIIPRREIQVDPMDVNSEVPALVRCEMSGDHCRWVNLRTHPLPPAWVWSLAAREPGGRALVEADPGLLARALGCPSYKRGKSVCQDQGFTAGLPGTAELGVAPVVDEACRTIYFTFSTAVEDSYQSPPYLAWCALDGSGCQRRELGYTLLPWASDIFLDREGPRILLVGVTPPGGGREEVGVLSVPLR